MVVQVQEVEVPVVWESEDRLSRLYYGDSLEAMALLPAESVGCVWTDLPYCFTHSTELILWATKAQKGKERYTFNYEDMKAENGAQVSLDCQGF